MSGLSKQQLEADCLFEQFISPDCRDRVFRIDGYAGVGKTHLMKHLLQRVDDMGRSHKTCTFTGKAASVLRAKGVPGAQTGHSLIYRAHGDSEDRLDDLKRQWAALPPDADPDKVQWLAEQIDLEKANLARPSFSINWESELVGSYLLAIDEHSMIDYPMGEDFMGFKTKVLALGDPAQLPPVGGPGFFSQFPVNYLMTEIQRQAAESTIIQLATRVRELRGLIYGEWDDAEIKAKATDDDLIWADQILVGRNATRHATNERVRALLGRSGALPVDGDKLVCLRNNNEKGFLNGTIWYVKGQPTYVGDKIGLRVVNEEGLERESLAWSFPFLNDDSGPKSFTRRREADEFGYGYALTVHKSQGSEWDKVLIFDESRAFGDDAPKWMYTAITRAAKNIKITKN